jgi:hypothetical protein
MMHARTDAAHEHREPANGSIRLEVGNRQLDSLRVFDGEHDEHDVERLQVEIALEMLKSVDGRVIDTDMSRDSSANDVIKMVFHDSSFSPGDSHSVQFLKAKSGPIGQRASTRCDKRLVRSDARRRSRLAAAAASSLSRRNMDGEPRLLRPYSSRRSLRCISHFGHKSMLRTCAVNGDTYVAPTKCAAYRRIIALVRRRSVEATLDRDTLTFEMRRGGTRDGASSLPTTRKRPKR